MPRNVLTLAELFAGRLFRIPDYQRGYAWGVRQVDELLEDIDLLPNDRTHYTGTVVLLPDPVGATVKDGGGIRNTWNDVVDGQQRLTTVVMLMQVVAEALADDPQAAGVRASTQERFVATTDANGLPLARLRPSASKPFWEESILHLGTGVSTTAPSDPSESRMSAARAALARGVSTRWTTPDALLALQDRVANQLVVTLYEVDDQSEVGVIFEVMNDRGKPLTELEKAKNYLMYVDSKLELEVHELDEIVNQQFGAIYRTLMHAGLEDGDDEEQFLRSHWLTTQDPDSRRWLGNRSIKDQFSLKVNRGRSADLLQKCTVYVNSLGQSSVAYADIVRPGRDGAFAGISDPVVREQIRYWSETLDRLGVRTALYPLLIAARLRLPNDGVDYLELVKLLERFCARVFEFDNYRSNLARDFFVRRGYQLHSEGAPAFGRIMEEIQSRVHLYCPDERLEAILRGQADHEPRVKYLLFEYEVHLCEEAGYPLQMSFERSKLQIEHILPQHPKDECWLSVFSEEGRGRLTEDLGNKVLSAAFANASMSNNCYLDKVGRPDSPRACYAKSSYRQERELFSRWASAWTPETIEQRRDKVADWALQRWHVPPPSETVDVRDIDVDDEQPPEA